MAGGGEICPGLEVRARLAGDDVDGTGDGVAAEEGSLRAAEHFDALDVDDREQRALRAGQVDAIQVLSDAGVVPEVGTLEVADAPDEGTGGAGATRSAGVELEVRYVVTDVVDADGTDVDEVQL